MLLLILTQLLCIHIYLHRITKSKATTKNIDIHKWPSWTKIEKNLFSLFSFGLEVPQILQIFHPFSLYLCLAWRTPQLITVFDPGTSPCFSQYYTINVFVKCCVMHLFKLHITHKSTDIFTDYQKEPRDLCGASQIL